MVFEYLDFNNDFGLNDPLIIVGVDSAKIYGTKIYPDFNLLLFLIPFINLFNSTRT